MNRTVLHGANQRPHLDRPPPERGTVMMERPQLPTAFAKNSQMVAMFFASSELLSFADVLPQLGPSLPSPEALLGQVTQLFDRMSSQARDAGVSQEDVKQAQYALAALVDEQVLRAQWPGRYVWQQRPLQLQWFGENTAGDNFFVRMETLSRQANQAHVLEVFVMCLAHGFQGRYAMTEPHKLGPILEQQAASLATALVPLEPLSPHAVRAVRRVPLVQAPVIRIALVVLGVAIVLVIVMRVALSASASSVEKASDAYVASPPPQAGASK
jgi:type VI secretion system protein ImpK